MGAPYIYDISHLRVNLALNLRVHPLASLCFCYNNMYRFVLCTNTSTVSALTLILPLALPLLFINTYTSTASVFTLTLTLALSLLL
jgi:hypothetical protein